MLNDILLYQHRIESSMASEDDIELTQSQSHNTQDNFASQNGEDENDVWGRLKAKHDSFQSVGKKILSQLIFFEAF